MTHLQLQSSIYNRHFSESINPVPQIVVENLTKSFRVDVRESGLVGSIKALVTPKYQRVFALDQVARLCG